MRSHNSVFARFDSSLVAGLVVATLLLVLACVLVGCDAAGQSPDADGAQTSQQQQAAQPADGAADPSAATAVIDTRGNLGAFEAGTLDGGTFTQADLAAYDATVLFFWSTTCGPCVNKLPGLAGLAQRLPANVQVATVCFDGNYNNERAQQVVEAAGFTGPTVITTSKGLTQLAQQVQYTPTTVFIASDGTLVGDVFVGNPGDFDAAYLAAINLVLEWQGKEAVSLEPAA